MLLDSNILIYAAKPEFAYLLEFMRTNAVRVSAISKIEVLGYLRLSAMERQCFEGFFRDFEVYSISDPIIEEAVKLRQTHKMTLGDAIIAATARCHNFTLVTRNIDDFAWINDLQLLNPLDR